MRNKYKKESVVSEYNNPPLTQNPYSQVVKWLTPMLLPVGGVYYITLVTIINLSWYFVNTLYFLITVFDSAIFFYPSY